ncbi:MAG: S1C family serine protease [Nitrososphaeria archaeon]
MASAISKIQAIIIIVAVIMAAGSGLVTGMTFAGKTITVTTKTPEVSTVTITRTALNCTTTLTLTNISQKGDAVEIFKEAYPSVLQITVYDRSLRRVGLGSGFVYDHQGHIVTNHHVIEDGAYFVVSTYQDELIRATLRGSDVFSDLAVLEANLSSAISPFKLATSVTVGEPVFAIGSPFGLKGSITAGILSQVNRTGITFVPMLQTDAAINPGNSGGPLLNSRGEVIGVTTAGIAKNVSEGVGFAIPSTVLQRVIPKLIESGQYKHPFIGITGEYLDPIIAAAFGLPENLTYGFIVTGIVAGSAASKSELKLKDVIIGIDEYSIRKDPDINYLMTFVYSPGDKVTFTVIRGDRKIQIQLTLGERR